jgi:hypothetical protein
MVGKIVAVAKTLQQRRTFSVSGCECLHTARARAPTRGPCVNTARTGGNYAEKSFLLLFELPPYCSLILASRIPRETDFFLTWHACDPSSDDFFFDMACMRPLNCAQCAVGGPFYSREVTVGG